jgi:hypothetical protein
MGNSGSASNASQVGVNSSSTTSLMITNGGINNSIFSILTGATWFPKTGANNNNNITGTANLAFASGLSTDAIPVLTTGSGSLARDYVVTNYLTTPLLTDEIGNPRVGYTDAGAYENQNAGFAVAASATTGGGYIVTGVGTYDSGTSASITAAANAGYSFVNWTENGTEVSTLATYAFTVSAARTLVANFIAVSAVPEVKQEKFIIIKDNVLTFPGASGSIDVYNALGKLVVSQKVNGNTLTLKNAGIYIVKNTSVDGVKVQKIIIN